MEKTFVKQNVLKRHFRKLLNESPYGSLAADVLWGSFATHSFLREMKPLMP